MKILYDYQAFRLHKYGGVTRYFCQLFQHLSGLADVQIHVAAGLNRNVYLQEMASKAGCRIQSWAPPPWLGMSRWVALANRMPLNAAALKFRPDVYHATYYNWLSVPTGARRVVTVFDMIHEMLPQYFPAGDNTPQRKMRAVQRVDGILCISKSTQDDLIRILNVPREKTCVVYLGSNLNSVPEDKSPINSPYILYVGNRGGYKNFRILADAFGRSGDLHGHFKLVCFGGGAFTTQEQTIFRELHIAERVEHKDGDDRILATLYNHACMLVYPSLYEGFGMPVLEAMSLGCPVIAVKQSSIPEVAGEAAIYFDPADADDLCSRMRNVASDNALKANLRERGFERAKMFNWSKTAIETLAFYRKISAQ